MASGAMGVAVRELRDLFRSGSSVGLTDGQLLARYAGFERRTGLRCPGGAAWPDGPVNMPGCPAARA